MTSGYSPQDPYASGQQGNQSPTGYYGQQAQNQQPPFQAQPYHGQSYQGYQAQAATQHGQPYPPYPVLQEHPQGTTILVLGVLSIVVPVLGFVAWYMGHKVQREIDETGAIYSNLGNISAGRIIGMIMSILTIAGFALFLVYAVIMIIMVLGMTASMP
jgi:hypothetical protein